MSSNQENKDWNKDNFPTSARPVFSGLGLLFLVVGIICSFVYFSSEHEPVKKEEATKSGPELGAEIDDFSDDE